MNRLNSKVVRNFFLTAIVVIVLGMAQQQVIRIIDSIDRETQDNKRWQVIGQNSELHEKLVSEYRSCREKRVRMECAVLMADYAQLLNIQPSIVKDVLTAAESIED